MTDASRVIDHYGRTDLRQKIEAALAAAGLSEGKLSPASLAPLDQFHTRQIAMVKTPDGLFHPGETVPQAAE